MRKVSQRYLQINSIKCSTAACGRGKHCIKLRDDYFFRKIFIVFNLFSSNFVWGRKTFLCLTTISFPTNIACWIIKLAHTQRIRIWIWFSSVREFSCTDCMFSRQLGFILNAILLQPFVSGTHKEKKHRTPSHAQKESIWSWNIRIVREMGEGFVCVWW